MHITSKKDLLKFSTIEDLYTKITGSNRQKGLRFEFFCKLLLEHSNTITNDSGVIAKKWLYDNGIDIHYKERNIAVQCKLWRKKMTKQEVKNAVENIQEKNPQINIETIIIIASGGFSLIPSEYKKYKEKNILLLDSYAIIGMMRTLSPDFEKNNTKKVQIQGSKESIDKFFKNKIKIGLPTITTKFSIQKNPKRTTHKKQSHQEKQKEKFDAYYLAIGGFALLAGIFVSLPTDSTSILASIFNIIG